MAEKKKNVVIVASCMISGRIYPPGEVRVTEAEYQGLADSSENVLHPDYSPLAEQGGSGDDFSGAIQSLEKENAVLKNSITAQEEENTALKNGLAAQEEKSAALKKEIAELKKKPAGSPNKKKL